MRYGLDGLTRILALILLACCQVARAQILYVDLYTVSTNYSTNYGSITIPGSPYTNAPFSLLYQYNIGDPLETAFNKINLDLAFLWNWDNTNNFGTGGGGGTATNAIPIYNGGGTNLTVTNSLNIISTTPYFVPSYFTTSGLTVNPYNIFTSITVTGLVTACLTNSPFVLDTNTADETWGTLTD